jgi:hypothetical protein
MKGKIIYLKDFLFYQAIMLFKLNIKTCSIIIISIQITFIFIVILFSCLFLLYGGILLVLDITLNQLFSKVLKFNLGLLIICTVVGCNIICFLCYCTITLPLLIINFQIFIKKILNKRKIYRLEIQKIEMNKNFEKNEKNIKN